MDAMRQRLRRARGHGRDPPNARALYEALDQGQKVRFAGMS